MPRIQFKTVTNGTFHVELADDDTFATVKQKIAKEKGTEEYPVEAQKLIFNGKVLEDTKTVKQMQITEDKFIVITVVKKSTIGTNSTAKPSVPSTTTNKEKKDGKGEIEGNAAKTENKAGGVTDEKKTTPNNSETSNAPAQASVPATASFSANHVKIVDNIVAMGYPRESAIQACQAAFFNLERAVEYLCTGIPEAVSANQENTEFQLIGNMISRGTIATNVQPERGNADNAPAGQPAVQLTQQDREAIARLVAMGFSQEVATEAYITCDRNEILAVNYILRTMDERSEPDNAI